MTDSTCPVCRQHPLTGRELACRDCWHAMPNALSHALAQTARIRHRDHAPWLDSLAEAQRWHRTCRAAR